MDTTQADALRHINKMRARYDLPPVDHIESVREALTDLYAESGVLAEDSPWPPVFDGVSFSFWAADGTWRIGKVPASLQSLASRQ